MAVDIKEIQAAVGRLLRYAVADADRDVNKTLIAEVVPLLYKDHLNEQDQETLWRSYNTLSMLVTPANNESLQFKELMEEEDRKRTAKDRTGFFRAFLSRLKDSFSDANEYPVSTGYQRHSALLLFFAVVFGIVFLFLQSYTSTLSDSLKEVEQYRADLTQIEAQISTAKAAKTNGLLDLCATPFKELAAQKDQLLLKIDGHYHAVRDISNFFPHWEKSYSNYTSDYYRSKTTACSAEYSFFQHTDEDSYLAQQAEAERETFFAGAKSILRLCNYLLLPFVMGTLGATAYVIRKLLDSFSEASLSFGPNRKGYVRIGLGALLGLISGVVITPGIKEIQEIRYSPLVWAFLMGYSVEFAFGIFDMLIKRGREALQTSSKPSIPPIPQQNPPTAR